MQRDITGDGETGLTLSQAMEKHPRLFHAKTIETIRRAEAEGNLALTLRRLNEINFTKNEGARFN